MLPRRALELLVFCVVLVTNAQVQKQSIRTDNTFWNSLAKAELEEALAIKWNTGVAKNVILFVGDGMGPNTVTATRIYAKGESRHLLFEKFPHIGLLKTYSANKMVPDSASTATALFCGVKANYKTAGVDATVQQGDCAASLKEDARPKSLAVLALEAGKSAGLVTTMRVTHATPTPIYGHSADRAWECEASIPTEQQQCKDIARQLVEDWPGTDLNVILGGGRQVLVSNSSATADDPLDTWSCISKDGRNLIEKYKQLKEDRKEKYAIVSNTGELKNVDYENTDYLLGIFANGHLKYEHERDTSDTGTPSISKMVEAAIKVLQRNEKGFFLMVEGGNIDMAHHRGKAKKAITEAAAMEEAARLAVSMTDEEDTLLIVTSDHTHTLNINGYPDRGSNVFGVTGPSRYDGVNYTSLSYSTGGPGAMYYYAAYNGTVKRKEPNNTDSFDYEQVAGIILDENSHGGGDVAVYARGPYAHLFHNVHEQHYVYHVISFAAKMGAYSAPSGGYVVTTSHAIVYLICIWLTVYCFKGN